MKRQPSSPAAVPGLDLRTLELGVAVKALRDWGRSCLQALAAEPPNLPLDLAALLRLEPFLMPWYGSAAEPRRLNARIKRLVRLQQQVPRQLTQPLSLALVRGLAVQGRSRRLRHRLVTRSGLERPPAVPFALWPLIAELAWQSPGFQYTVAATLRSHLRTRYLFTSGELPVVILNPRTFWLLIDLLGVTRLRSRKHRKQLKSPAPLRTRLGRMVQRRAHGIHWRDSMRQIARRLAALAQGQVAGLEWADLWDQWLIVELAGRQPELIARATTPSQRVLAALPWLRSTATDNAKLVEVLGRRRPPKDEPPLSVAAPGWRENLPFRT
jgi:hypothetical protein